MEERKLTLFVDDMMMIYVYRKFQRIYKYLELNEFVRFGRL